MFSPVRRLFSTSSNTQSGLLSGIRVLDLSRILAGPYCSMILGDMGADVIKVEKPTGGDDTRSWGPPFTEQGGESAYFLCCNRNKRSIAIDFKHPRGLKVLQDLVVSADVLIENFVPGKLDSIGLGYDTLKALNPGLIYASLTGYGPSGPYVNKPGYDVMVCAQGGLMNITGTDNGPPCKPGVALTDISTGLYMHGAIIAALFARQSQQLKDPTAVPVGQKIDCSLMATQVAVLANLGQNYLLQQQDAKRWGTAHASIVPYQAFQDINEEYFVIGALNDVQYKKLCGVVNDSRLGDEKYATNKLRVANRDTLVPLLQDLLGTRSRSEWIESLEQAGLACAPVNNMEQVFSDPQVVYSQAVQHIEHPTVGQIPLVGPAVTYDRNPCSIRLPPPTLGQHTYEILTDLLELSDDDLQELDHEGVIGLPS